MDVRILPTAAAMSAAAADAAAASLARTIAAAGTARLVLATAASQIGFQRELTERPELDWTRIEIFQLDEYVGLADDHPARFSRLLTDHVLRPAGAQWTHRLSGRTAPEIIDRISRAISAKPVDLAVLGIGENAHLAFNDPPADFETDAAYAIVTLDETCRRQQVGEGWFERLEDVPGTAISMTIQQILKAREILVVVPDARKAAAVHAALEGDLTPDVPASILRTHPNVTIFLDEPAASRLRKRRS
jgi:glucosamine-6-phosphate deaminase